MKNATVHVCILVAGLLTGLPAVSRAQAQSVSLISTGSTWRYLDNGTDPGPGWRSLAFVDAAWPSGPAQLGYGEGDEATVLTRTNAAGATNITFYFRHTFDVADLASVSNLLVRVRRDDGAIVYLNDAEVFRSNMPPGPVTPGTTALGATSDDGAGFHANAVDRAGLVTGQNILAVEVHQSAINSSDVSFDLELISNVQFQPPTVAISSPTNGATVASLHLPITAAADDVDGTIAIVEFFEGGTLLGNATAAPFSVTWSNVIAGRYTLTAVAIDSTGLGATSAPVTITVPERLIPSGSAWRYLDTGADPGASWAASAFEDSGWPSGFAELGFGDGGEATVLSRTNALGETNITYYFRHSFEVPNPASATNLVIRVRRDDGCVAYLNGTEVFRDNMPLGPISAATLAVAAIDDSRFRAGRIDPALLVSGLNVVAVEVHQATVTSSDVSFDLELRPNLPPTAPVIVITSPTNGSRYVEPATIAVNAAGTDVDDRIATVGFLINGALAGTDATEPFGLPMTAVGAGNYTVLAIATDEFGNATTSAPVQFSVVKPPVVVSLIATGSVWKYFDGGTDLGTAWRERLFNDAAWNSGPGKLGFADNPATPIDIGPVGNRYLTTYFRHRFQVANAIDVTNLAFRVLRDDGCVAYLNGVELFRMNMPPGFVTYTSRAVTAVGGTNEYHYYPIAVEPPYGSLLEGENVLAVELHQSDSTSSDAGFDLGLSAVSPPPGSFTRIAVSAIGPSIRIEWAGTGFVLQSAAAAGGPYSDIVPAVTASPYVVPSPPGNRFYRLRQGP